MKIFFCFEVLTQKDLLHEFNLKRWIFQLNIQNFSDIAPYQAMGWGSIIIDSLYMLHVSI